MRKIVNLLLIFVIASGFSGCYSLRKKFTRKRAKETPPPLYLNLKEYPKVPTKDMYDEYYLFVRGWLSELIRDIENNISPKRQRKSIDEALKNLEQIVYFYNEEGKKKINPIYKELVKLREKVYDPYFITSGNDSSTVRDISRIRREFEKEFSFEKVSDLLIKEEEKSGSKAVKGNSGVISKENKEPLSQEKGNEGGN